jgi:hypothetical protein
MCRNTIGNHFLHPGHIKRYLDEFAEVKFQVGKWPWEIKICLLEVLKGDFGDVDEEMFQGVERPCELIFYLLGIQKTDLDEVAELKF